MTQRHLSLTDKEKETLRLLVQGYDAKSMARRLGLSVHTVNERLRDARRKLGTSSSREAARLLREAEGESPELLGDKDLGDAPQDQAQQMSPQPAQGRGISRRTGWIFGGLTMSATLALLALSALSGTGQTPTIPFTTAAAVSATPASEQAAIEAALQFLALVDRNDWTASWQATHKSFQLLNTVDWWADASQQVRGEMGTLQSRELATVDFRPAPPNGYWTVTFKAKYSKKGNATETLSLASENGGWRVASITVD
ncbi:MAG: DUF4019 domain-containing protein [Pseudomonadota bacterium]|nr:DUF4019 domain-containing protein [Pseudomonadota bacterium]